MISVSGVDLKGTTSPTCDSEIRLSKKGQHCPRRREERLRRCVGSHCLRPASQLTVEPLSQLLPNSIGVISFDDEDFGQNVSRTGSHRYGTTFSD